MSIELAKCLALVAPTSMSGEARSEWILAAVDALQGIRADEVGAVSHELRRSVTRHNQIVPELAKLIAERRNHREPPKPSEKDRIAQDAAHTARKASEKVMRLSPDDRRGIEGVERWKREELRAKGCTVPPVAMPLDRDELDHLPDHIISLGLTAGLIERRDGRLREVRLEGATH